MPTELVTSLGHIYGLAMITGIALLIEGRGKNIKIFGLFLFLFGLVFLLLTLAKLAAE